MSDATTSRLGLYLPDKASIAWHTKLNANFTALDSAYGDIRSYVAERPEVYQLAGSFADEPGAAVALPKSVDSTDDYTVSVTPTARTSAIGDIWVVKGTDSFVVHRSGSSIDGFVATVYYSGEVNGYGSQAFRQWYVSPVSGDHSSSDLEYGLKWVLDRAGSNMVNLMLPGSHTYTISNDLTIPSTAALIPQHGAVFSIASGKTLTINGPFHAGMTEVFSGDGSVVFGNGSVSAVYPEWFGTAGNGTDTGGTDDTNRLQAALSSMPADSTLVISATHRVSSSLTPKSFTRISGARGGGLISKPSTSWADTAMISIPESVTCVEAAGLRLNGNKANNVGGRTFGIAVLGASNITIEGCFLTNFPTSSPTGNGGDGIYVGTGASGSIPQEVRILNNTVYANQRTGIAVISVSGLLVEGNHVTYTETTNTGAGIDIEPNSASDTVRDVRIIGNRFNNNAGPGILLYNSNNNTITDVVISGNVVRDNSKHGIWLYRTANGFNGTYAVTGNVIRANGQSGMYLDSCYGAAMVIQGNTIHGNGESGVAATGSSAFNLSGNSICSNGRHGVCIDYVYGGKIEAMIASNTVMNNSASASNSHDGIFLAGNGSHIDFSCLIQGNICANSYHGDVTATQRYGVNIQPNARNMVVSGNWTFHNLTGGVSVAAYSYSPIGFNFDSDAGYWGSAPAGAVATMSSTAYTSSNAGLILVDASAGEVDPRLSPSIKGHRITVKKTDGSANKVVVRGQPGETIDGAEYFELPSIHRYVTCVYVGDGMWKVVANN